MKKIILILCFVLALCSCSTRFTLVDVEDKGRVSLDGKTYWTHEFSLDSENTFQMLLKRNETYIPSGVSVEFIRVDAANGTSANFKLNAGEVLSFKVHGVAVEASKINKFGKEYFMFVANHQVFLVD